MSVNDICDTATVAGDNDDDGDGDDYGTPQIVRCMYVRYVVQPTMTAPMTKGRQLLLSFFNKRSRVCVSNNSTYNMYNGERAFCLVVFCVTAVCFCVCVSC